MNDLNRMNQLNKLIQELKNSVDEDFRDYSNHSLIWAFGTSLLKYYEIDEVWGKDNVLAIKDFLMLLFIQRNKIQNEMIRRMEKYE